VFLNGALIASGTADGPPVQTSLPDRSNVAPTAQMGYFSHFGDSRWLWGVKFSYSYLGTRSSVDNLVIPQFGTSSAQGVSTFTGFSVTNSYTVDVYNQMTFMPIVGRSFDNGFIYAFGPAATVGVTYFLTPSWFVDLSYSFAAPNPQTFYVASPFNNPGSGGPSFQGTLIGTYTANLTTHAIGLKINCAF